MKEALLSCYFALMLMICGAQVDSISISEVVEPIVERDLFEGQILIAEGGDIIYHQSFGYVDAEKSRLVQNENLFGIASVTKLFTAIVVLQLVEEQKLKLDDKLVDFFPDLNIPWGRDISIHHLLLHISGLANEADSIYNSPIKAQALVQMVLNSGQKQQKPGTYNYNNIDYVLLGLIIEQIEELAWREVLQNRIISPLGLNNTGHLMQGFYPKTCVRALSMDTLGRRIPDPAIHIENFYAAGDMYSCAEDLLKLDQAMYGESLLSQKMKDLMYHSYPEYNYTGYSVWTYNYPFVENKPRIMERRGGILGNNVVLVRFLELNRTIIVLNHNGSFNSDSFGDFNNLKEALILKFGNLK